MPRRWGRSRRLPRAPRIAPSSSATTTRLSLRQVHQFPAPQSSRVPQPSPASVLRARSCLSVVLVPSALVLPPCCRLKRLFGAINASRFSNLEPEAFNKIWDYYGGAGPSWLLLTGVSLCCVLQSLGEAGCISRQAVEGADTVTVDTNVVGLYMDLGVQGSEAEADEPYLGSSFAHT